jgi:hypothetical protein
LCDFEKSPIDYSSSPNFHQARVYSVKR